MAKFGAKTSPGDGDHGDSDGGCYLPMKLEDSRVEEANARRK